MFDKNQDYVVLALEQVCPPSPGSAPAALSASLTGAAHQLLPMSFGPEHLHPCPPPASA